MNRDALLSVKNLTKTYIQGKSKINIFSDLNLELQKQEVLALLGPSGSGKTSLLNILGLLDSPTKGEIIFNGSNMRTLNENQRSKVRGRDIGFVFQFHHLLPDFSAVENVVIPQLIQGVDKATATKTAKEILFSMGLSQRGHHFPSMLSGGEQQRVAIARAICCKPSLIIADEPTGNLDSKTAKEIFDILLNLVREHGISIIIATHSREIAAKTDRRIEFIDGNLVET